jgi:trimeric autotransporter adhesin
LNMDFRYQLTCIGQFAQAIVANEISNNTFVIQTDLPNVKVSWQVTGTRNDPYARDHRLPVEKLKTGTETGRYIYPQGYGKSAASSLPILKPTNLSGTAIPEPVVKRSTEN